LRRYYRSDTGNNTTGSMTAELRAEEEVTFDEGAYVVPMDQVAGAVIAMLFEPDTAGSASYNSSVSQSVSGAEGFALMFHDFTTRDYPHYRLEKSDPYTWLPPDTPPDDPCKPVIPPCIEDKIEDFLDCMGCNAGYGLLALVFAIPFVLRKRP